MTQIDNQIVSGFIYHIQRDMELDIDIAEHFFISNYNRMKNELAEKVLSYKDDPKVSNLIDLYIDFLYNELISFFKDYNFTVELAYIEMLKDYIRDDINSDSKKVSSIIKKIENESIFEDTISNIFKTMFDN